MRITFYIAVLISLLLSGCNSEQTLQKYFVENSGKKDFIQVDLSSSLINKDKTKLTTEQKIALASFDKMNIIAFKADATNKTQYDFESQKVAEILKNKEYQQLIKVGSGKDAATVNFVGDENHINEFVFFAKNKENGFAVVRILGKDMNPNNIMNMIALLKSANLNMDALKPLQGLIK